MKPALKISASEWEVLDAVWECAPATSPQIYERLADKQEWHIKTVNTFLARLVEKGILAVERNGRANIYTPLLTRQECVKKESESFLKRVFRGASKPLLVHFCENAELSEREIEELQQLLEAKMGAGSDSAAKDAARKPSGKQKPPHS